MNRVCRSDMQPARFSFRQVVTICLNRLIVEKSSWLLSRQKRPLGHATSILIWGVVISVVAFAMCVYEFVGGASEVALKGKVCVFVWLVSSNIDDIQYHLSPQSIRKRVIEPCLFVLYIIISV